MTENLLTQLDSIPDGFIESDATDLYKILPGPTLIHLSGRHEQPLFVSVLQHGNETTGLRVIQKFLKKYQGKELPRSLSFFVGNVQAAKHGMRRLENQPDYNRVWPGSQHELCPESLMMQQIIDEMLRRSVFASIDIHNTSGKNPHYACINRLDNQFFQLASLFGRMVVYFLTPIGVQSLAFAGHCPAVTLECGKPGNLQGENHALEYLEACLHLTELSDHEVKHGDLDLYHTAAQVKIRETVDFSFTDPVPEVDMILETDLDRMNFTEIVAGTAWARVKDDQILPVIARTETGDDVSHDYFDIKDGKLVSTKAVMPSMLTLDEKILRQDCLCYLMERMSI